MMMPLTSRQAALISDRYLWTCLRSPSRREAARKKEMDVGRWTTGDRRPDFALSGLSYWLCDGTRLPAESLPSPDGS